MTNWANTLSALTFNFMFIDTFRQYRAEKRNIPARKETLLEEANRPESSEETSPWQLWKWSQIFYQTTFALTICVSFIFWVFIIGDFLDTYNENEWPVVVVIATSFDHSVPVMLHGIDWFFHQLEFDWRHCFAQWVVIIVYSICNVIFTLTSGTIAYR